MDETPHARDGGRLTVGLYIVAAAAVVVMEAVPGEHQAEMRPYVLGAVTALLGITIAAVFGVLRNSRPVLATTVLACSVLVTVSVAVAQHIAGHTYHAELFYLLPILVAAYFHGPRLVAASIALATIGGFVALATPTAAAAADRSDEIANAVVGATVIGTAFGAAGFIVHRLRQRDLALRAHLSGLANTDPLTGLANRRGLEQLVDQGAFAPGHSTVAMLDLDDFKRINDTEGHAVGDRVLEAVAEVLTTRLRPTDLAVRFGGEEFVVLLRDLTPDDAAVLTTDVATALRAIDAAEARITASVGLTEWAHGERLSDAVRRADAAVYDAKRAGRDRSCIRTVDGDVSISPHHAAGRAARRLRRRAGRDQSPTTSGLSGSRAHSCREAV